MSKSDVSNVFTPYFQTKDVESRKLNLNGHSLGLSISRNMANLLGGSLLVESMLGLGTTFTLALKLEGRVTNVDDHPVQKKDRKAKKVEKVEKLKLIKLVSVNKISRILEKISENSEPEEN